MGGLQSGGQAGRHRRSSHRETAQQGGASSGSRAGTSATAQLLSRTRAQCPLCLPHPLSSTPTAPALPSRPAFSRRWRCCPVSAALLALPGLEAAAWRENAVYAHIHTHTRVHTLPQGGQRGTWTCSSRHPPECINSSGSAGRGGYKYLQAWWAQLGTPAFIGWAWGWRLSLFQVVFRSGGCYFRPRCLKSLLL